MANRLSAWSVLLICLAMLGVYGLSAIERTTMENGLTSVHFERSGGFGNIMVAGDVVLGTASLVKDAKANGVSRPLTAAEKAMFARLDPARLREFKGAGSGDGVPDDYQYDLTLTFADRNVSKLKFHGQSMAELGAVPGLAELAAWVTAEADAILARR